MSGPAELTKRDLVVASGGGIKRSRCWGCWNQLLQTLWCNSSHATNNDQPPSQRPITMTLQLLTRHPWR